MAFGFKKCSASKIEFARSEIGIIDLDSSIAYIAEPINLVKLGGKDLNRESDKLIEYARLATELRRKGISIKYVNPNYRTRDCYNVFADV
jgi:hypothetical protein